LSSKSEWDELVERVEEIECDLSDIGFMIEFVKIWNKVKEEGNKTQKKLLDVKQLFLDIEYESYRADGWMMKEAKRLLEDS